MDCLFPGVGRLGVAAQKHHRSSDVLASPSKLKWVVLSVQYVTLELTGMTPSAACRVMRMWRSVLHRAHQRRWQLALPPLS